MEAEATEAEEGGAAEPEPPTQEELDKEELLELFTRWHMANMRTAEPEPEDIFGDMYAKALEIHSKEETVDIIRELLQQGYNEQDVVDFFDSSFRAKHNDGRAATAAAPAPGGVAATAAAPAPEGVAATAAAPAPEGVAADSGAAAAASPPSAPAAKVREALGAFAEARRVQSPSIPLEQDYATLMAHIGLDGANMGAVYNWIVVQVGLAVIWATHPRPSFSGQSHDMEAAELPTVGASAQRGRDP